MSVVPIQMAITGPRGCVARALKAWMAVNHPEIDILPIPSFPFSMSRLWDHLRGGQVRYLVNCAGLGSDSESAVDPLGYYATNATGVTHQLEVIRQFSPTTRYLNLGTIYEPSSSSVYSSSKRMARDAVTTYRSTYGLYAVTATLGFTEYYGRRECFLARRITKGVATLARALREGTPFSPFRLRDLDEPFIWTWAEDVAAGMWTMLNRDTPQDSRLVNARTSSIRAFLKVALDEAGIGGEWTHLNRFIVRVPGAWLPYLVIDGEDTDQMTLDDSLLYAPPVPDWEATTPFETLVRNLMRWELKQEGLLS